MNIVRTEWPSIVPHFQMVYDYNPFPTATKKKKRKKDINTGKSDYIPDFFFFFYYISRLHS